MFSSHRFVSDWNSCSSTGNIKIEKKDLFILGGLRIHQIDTQSRIALLEIIEGRHLRVSTKIVSRLTVAKWFHVIEAVLDRLVHNAQRLELKSDSLRKKR